MQAKDIMRKNVVTASPTATLREIAELFVSRRITGAPVVDERGRLVGVISQTDLVRDQSAEGEVPSFQRRDELMPELHSSAVLVEPEKLVQDVMNTAALSADEAAPVEELARVMLGKRIHRILITNKGKLSGIVTAMDMLRAIPPARPKAARAETRAEGRRR